MQYDTGKYCVYYHRYHIVWSTKYRHKVLTGALRLRVRDICRQVCRENEVDILRGVLSSDHVHMFVSVPPKIAISDLVRKLKGRSSHKVKREFSLFLTDGRVAIDNNPAERALRPIGIGRKNWLFAGADTGAETLARAMTIIETAKLNGLDPQAYLADILDRIHDHKINRLDELLPWNWAPLTSAPDSQAAKAAVSTERLRWKRWSDKGIFAQMMAGLAAEHGEKKMVIIDATYLKAHRTASSLGARKGGVAA